MRLNRISGMEVRKAVVAMAAALLVSAGIVGISPDPAAAATVRPGKGFGQVDLLLDGWDKDRVIANGNYAKGLWAASVICWQSGVAGKALSIGVCQTAVQVCALRAHFHHKWAGMTSTWYPYPNWWCWEY